MNQRIAMLLALATLTLSVAACGDGEPAGESAGRPAPAGQARDGGASVGGDTLSLGQRAVSSFVDYGSAHEKPTKVGIRVLDVRKGRIADLKDFNLDRKHRRSVPYYVDAKFENLGGFTLTRNLLRASVEDQDGREYRPATLVVLGGTFRPCPQDSGSKLRPGESFTGCSAVLLPKGTELDRVRFQGDVTKDPLFWQPN
jgi:hypothetical protein